VCWRRERRKNNEEGGDAREKERIGRGWVTVTIYRRNLNIQRPKLNYSHVIHPISESSMWISKQLCFNEIFASAVSDQPSEQRFKKSNFRYNQSLLVWTKWGKTIRVWSDRVAAHFCSPCYAPRRQIPINEWDHLSYWWLIGLHTGSWWATPGYSLAGHAPWSVFISYFVYFPLWPALWTRPYIKLGQLGYGLSS
jgi:hypothetical protein